MYMYFTHENVHNSVWTKWLWTNLNLDDHDLDDFWGFMYMKHDKKIFLLFIPLIITFYWYDLDSLKKK